MSCTAPERQHRRANARRLAARLFLLWLRDREPTPAVAEVWNATQRGQIARAARLRDGYSPSDETWEGAVDRFAGLVEGHQIATEIVDAPPAVAAPPDPFAGLGPDELTLRCGRDACQCAVSIELCECSRGRANARLIAAAPDLLAALQNLVPRFRACILSHGSDAEYADDAVAGAQAAIHKATGAA